MMETRLVPNRKIIIPADPEILAPFSPNKKEECGIFGIFGREDCAKLAYFGLYALRAGGRKAPGIRRRDGCQITSHKNMGLVHDIFSEERLKALKGYLAIGHVRYSTTDRPFWRTRSPSWFSTGTTALRSGTTGTW